LFGELAQNLHTLALLIANLSVGALQINGRQGGEQQPRPTAGARLAVLHLALQLLLDHLQFSIRQLPQQQPEYPPATVV
jgi:hypothetical protein